jgi:putative tricarboxylic transport membrane protein
VQTSKTPERFGKGAIEGVIAPDATLGATEGGALLPTLAFGIPGGEAMAVLLVAFIGLGIVPGPEMLTRHLDVVFSFVWVVVIASTLTTLVGLAIIPYLARLPTLNPNIVIPIVLSVCFVGAYSTHGTMDDVVVTMVFGLIGFLMDRFNFSRANFVIGMVLAVMIERNLHLSLSLYGSDFIITRPVTLVMFILLIVTTALPFVRKWRRRKTADADASVRQGSPP